MKQSEIVLGGVTAAVVGSFVLWSYVASPTIDRWRAATEREEAQNDKLQRYQTLINKGPEMRGELMAIDFALRPPAPAPEETDKNDVANMGGEAIAGFLSHLNSLTEAAGFKPVNLHFVRAEAYDAYSELRFELKAKAPLKQIHDFMVKMTASDWYLRVQSLSITPREGTEVEADMSLVALATADTVEPEPKQAQRGRAR